MEGKKENGDMHSVFTHTHRKKEGKFNKGKKASQN